MSLSSDPVSPSLLSANCPVCLPCQTGIAPLDKNLLFPSALKAVNEWDKRLIDTAADKGRMTGLSTLDWNSGIFLSSQHEICAEHICRLFDRLASNGVAQTVTAYPKLFHEAKVADFSLISPKGKVFIKVIMNADEKGQPVVYLKIRKPSDLASVCKIKGGEKKICFAGRFSLWEKQRIEFDYAVLVRPRLTNDQGQKLEESMRQKAQRKFDREAKFYDRYSQDLIAVVKPYGLYEDGGNNKKWIALHKYDMDLWQMSSKLTPKERVFVAEKILRAISSFEKNNILQRDIKPQNIFVKRLEDGSLEVAIGDWGGMIKYDEDNPDCSYSICGTPEFLAPECYSLLYETIVLKRPLNVSYHDLLKSDAVVLFFGFAVPAGRLQ